MKRLLSIILLITSLFAQGQHLPSATIYNGTYTPSDNLQSIMVLNGQVRRVPAYRIGQDRQDSAVQAMATYAKLQRLLDSLTAIRATLAGKQASGDYALSSALTSGLSGKADLVGGKVPESQLPAYVDDVLEYANLASFPGTGSAGIIYVATDTDLSYRWSGTQYTLISSGAVTSVNSKTGVVSLNKTDIGLPNVPNTDATNPANIVWNSTYSAVSAAEKSTYNSKQDALGFTPVPNTRTVNGKALSSNITLNKADFTDLNNLDNTADIDKPISTATQNSLNGKQNVSDTNTVDATRYWVLQQGYGTGSGGSGDVTNSTISGIRALVSASSAVRYYITDSGKEGFFYYDASDLASSDDGALVLVSGTKRFKRIINNNTVYLKWYSGISDYTPIIASLINAGYKIEGEAGAVYPCTSGYNFTNKSAYLKGNGCKFTVNFQGATQSTIDYWLAFNNTPNTSYTVAGISPLNVAATSSGQTALQMSTSGGQHTSRYIEVAGDQTANFAKGDVIKLYSLDEYVPGSFPELGNGYHTILKGELATLVMVVYDGTKTRLVVQGDLYYYYNVTASNTKVCSMKKLSTHFEDFSVEYLGAGYVGGISVKGVYQPVFKDLTFSNFYNSVVETKCTWSGIVDNVTVINILNSYPQGFAPVSAMQSGYGVSEAASWGLKVTNCTFIGTRHGFTTGGGAQTANSTTDPFAIGETHSAFVSDNVAKGCAYPFDTHNQGANIMFNDNVMDAVLIGYQIRARGVTIHGGRITRANKAIYVAMKNASMVDDPLIIDGVDIDQIWTLNSAEAPAIDIDNEDEIKNVTIRNCRIHGGNIRLTYANADISNCQFDLTMQNGESPASAYWLWPSGGSSKAVCRNISVKAGSSFYNVRFNGSNSVVDINGLIVETTDSSPEIANQTSTTGNVLKIRNMVFKGANGPTLAASGTNSFPTASGLTSGFTVLRAEWVHDNESATPSSKNSNYVPLTTSGSSLTAPNTAFLLDKHIYLRCTPTTNSTITSFANGTFIGQKMTVHNATGTAGVTLVLPTLNSAKTLNQNQTATLTYVATGTWIYDN